MTKTTKQLIDEWMNRRPFSFPDITLGDIESLLEALKEAAELIKVSAEGFDPPLTDWLKKNGFEE